MRRLILLIFSLLAVFMSCNKSSQQTLSSNASKQSKLEQVAKQYTYGDLKQMLYIKERQMGGMLGVNARIFRSFYTKSATIELDFKNYALLTSFYDVKVELTFIGTNGKVFSKKQQVINDTIAPCQDVYFYRIRFNNALENVSSVSVSIVSYKTKMTDKI